MSVTLVTSHKTSHLSKHGQHRATQRNQIHDDVMCMVSWTVTRRRRWPHVLCCCFKQLNVGDFSLLFASKLSSRLDLHTSGMLIPTFTEGKWTVSGHSFSISWVWVKRWGLFKMNWMSLNATLVYIKVNAQRLLCVSQSYRTSTLQISWMHYMHVMKINSQKPTCLISNSF